MEASEATHKLLGHHRHQQCQGGSPQAAAAGRGDVRSEEGEKAVAVTYVRRRVSVAAVKAQCTSLLGRLEAGWGLAIQLQLGGGNGPRSRNKGG